MRVHISHQPKAVRPVSRIMLDRDAFETTFPTLPSLPWRTKAEATADYRHRIAAFLEEHGPAFGKLTSVPGELGLCAAEFGHKFNALVTDDERYLVSAQIYHERVPALPRRLGRARSFRPTEASYVNVKGEQLYIGVPDKDVRRYHKSEAPTKVVRKNVAKPIPETTQLITAALDDKWYSLPSHVALGVENLIRQYRTD